MWDAKRPCVPSLGVPSAKTPLLQLASRWCTSVSGVDGKGLVKAAGCLGDQHKVKGASGRKFSISNPATNRIDGFQLSFKDVVDADVNLVCKGVCKENGRACKCFDGRYTNVVTSQRKK